VNFGLGATLACTRKTRLRCGFESLLNRLADDYDLGTWIKRAGFRDSALDYVAETHAPDYDLHHFWNHRSAGTAPCATQTASRLRRTDIHFRDLLVAAGHGVLARNHVVGILFAAVIGMRYLMAIGAAASLSMINSYPWSLLLPLRDAMSMRCGRPATRQDGGVER